MNLRLFQYISFFIIPFLGGNHLSLFYFTIDKFWIETTFVLTLLIAVTIEFYKNKVVPSGFLKFLVFFTPFFLVNVASYFYTWNRFNTLNELNMLVWVAGCVYLFTASKNKDALLKALILGGALSVVCMIIQYKVMLPGLMEIFKGGKYGTVIQEKLVPFSSFLNEATLGGYFLFLIPLSIYFGVVQRKFLYMAMASIIIFGLLFSLSRMGMFIGALSLIAAFVFIISRQGVKKAACLVMVTILALSMLLSMFYIGKKANSDNYQSRAIEKVKTTAEHITTLTYRTITWKIAFSAWLDKPVTGYGAGTFEHAYKKYYDATLYTRYAHNVFVKIMVELGLTGLVCFLIFLFGFIINAIMHIRDILNIEKKDFFLLLSVVSGLFFAVFNVTFEMPAYTVTFFVLSSAFFADNKAAENRVIENQRHGPMAIISFLLIILTGSFLFTEKSNISLKTNEEGKYFVENGLSQQAFASYEEAIDAMPLNNHGYTGIVGILLTYFNYEQNEQEREKIRGLIIQYLSKIEHSPDKNSEFYFSAGAMNSLLGNNEKAEYYFMKALEHHPSSGFYMYETAAFYFSKGSPEKARTMIKRMKTYADRHRGSEMHGLYVYKMRDLEANIEIMEGNVENGLMIARKNLKDAEQDSSLTENIRAREYILKKTIIRHLKDRLEIYEAGKTGKK